MFANNPFLAIVGIINTVEMCTVNIGYWSSVTLKLISGRLYLSFFIRGQSLTKTVATDFLKKYIMPNNYGVSNI